MISLEISVMSVMSWNSCFGQGFSVISNIFYLWLDGNPMQFVWSLLVLTSRL